MLPRKNRLHEKKEIDHLYKKAHHHRVGPLLLSLANNQKGSLRATVIVSKKFSLLAVHRNQQKRILRATIETLLLKDADNFPYDLAIAYTKPGKMISYEKALESIKPLLEPYRSHH